MTRTAAAIRTLAFLSASCVLVAHAQMSPVGLWRSADDKSGEAKAEIRITPVGDALSGRIVKVLKKDAQPEARCDDCSGDRRGQPVVGLEIIRGARKVDGEDVWKGGRILDPENGREYTLRLIPVDGGQHLQVRGSIGPFGRTQTWTRVE